MSIIKSLSVRNFKAIGDRGATVALAPVTLLFGPNSAGKSSIIQSLHYANEILNRDNPDADRTLLGGDAIELGGFRNVLHQRELSREMTLTFELDLSKTDLPTYRVGYVTSQGAMGDWSPVFDAVSVSLTIVWSPLLSRPCVHAVKVEYDNNLWISTECQLDGKNPQLYLTATIKSEDDSSYPEVSNKSFLDEIGAVYASIVSDLYWDTDTQNGRLGIASAPVGGLRDALPVRAQPLDFLTQFWAEGSESPDRREFIEGMSSLVVGPVDILREELAKLVYVGPLREVPARHSQPARSPDPARWSSGLAAWDLLAADPNLLIERTNRWLTERDRFNSGYRIESERYKEVRADSPLGAALAAGELLDTEQARGLYEQLPEHRRVRLIDDNTGLALSPQDLGIGLSQTIPIIVASCHASDTLLVVEQPELHIHPAMQVEMGDLLIESARKRSVTFLVETHSEHLLLRILRRIRETSDGEVPPGVPDCHKDDVAVYFIEPDLDNKDARVTRLRIADDGAFLDRWPRGFFEERGEELF